MQYLELFDTTSHACGWRQEGHPVVKKLLQYSSLTLLKKEGYEGEVQPYRKTDYKPTIYRTSELNIWQITSFIYMYTKIL